MVFHIIVARERHSLCCGSGSSFDSSISVEIAIRQILWLFDIRWLWSQTIRCNDMGFSDDPTKSWPKIISTPSKTFHRATICCPKPWNNQLSTTTGPRTRSFILTFTRWNQDWVSSLPINTLLRYRSRDRLSNYDRCKISKKIDRCYKSKVLSQHLPFIDSQPIETVS